MEDDKPKGWPASQFDRMVAQKFERQLRPLSGVTPTTANTQEEDDILLRMFQQIKAAYAHAHLYGGVVRCDLSADGLTFISLEEAGTRLRGLDLGKVVSVHEVVKEIRGRVVTALSIDEFRLLDPVQFKPPPRARSPYGPQTTKRWKR